MAEPARTKAPASGPYALERDALSRFVELLERERLALLEPDADTLQALTREKLQLLQDLDRLRDKRAGSGKAGETEALAEIRALTTAAQRLNDINTRLLATQRTHCEARLKALRNNSALATVYGADGLHIRANG